MKIDTKAYKRCDVVKVEGRIDSATAPELAEALNALTEARRFNIVVDMEEVTFTSSATLRALISTQKICKQPLNHGELVLAAVPERIYETLDLAGLLPIFTLYNNVTEAVGSF